MAYDNRPNLNCRQFDQKGSDYLFLAGQNCICSGGTISSDNGYQVSGITVFDTGMVSSSIQIGCNAISSGIAATVVGTGALASGLTSISIGCNSKSCGNGSISIGTVSNAHALCGISIGCGGNACCDYSISIGANSISYGSGGIAVGKITKSYENSISIGNNSCATNINGIAIGENSIAINSSSIAIGYNTLAYCTCSHVIGNYICNNIKDSLGLGWYSGATYQTPSILFSDTLSYFYGKGDAKVGFGVCNPTARVDIYTTTTCGFKLVDGNQGAGRILTSDTNGYGKWCAVSLGITTANNGLNVIGSNVRLGGALTGNTSISANYTLTIGSCAKLNTECGYQISGNTILCTAKSDITSVFMGYNAGSNSVNSYNIGIGYSTLKCNPTGNNNIAAGFKALCCNTCGSHNIAFGNSALQVNTSGCNNIAIGSSSLYTNSVGYSNVAVGGGSLQSNTGGTQNVAIGASALVQNTKGNDNTAVGALALMLNTCGCHNVGIGYESVWKNTTGCENIGIGLFSLSCSQTGSKNVAVGICAGFSSVGSNNVYLGNSAGFYETGSNRLHIGNCWCCSLIYGEFDNKMVKIDGTLCASSNMCATNFILTSDERYKTNVSSISIAPVNIDYKQFEMCDEPNQLRYGVLAQELHLVNPELTRINSCGYLSVAYIDLLIKEVAYLKYKISELEKKIQ
jgi:hypothetical protein